MIFDSRLAINSPESVILDILSRKAKLTSIEIYDFFVAKYGKTMSIQGFYKIIRKMLNNRILLKEGSHISLDSYWINKLIEFTKNIEKTYLASEINTSNILLEEGESKEMEFENITAMDNVWSHGLNVVRQYYAEREHADKNAYSRHYFSVFQIARTESESTNIEYFESSQMGWFMASGSDTFLNRLPAKLIDKENYHQFIFDFEKYKKNHAEAEKNYWVTVIGDFIFEARFPKYIFELLEKIYEETQTIGEFNANRINGLFLEPGKTFLTVSRNKKKAETIRTGIKSLYQEFGQKK